MAKYLLVSFKTCPWVQRAAIVLREKKVDFEFRHIEPDNRPDWFLAISPHKKVPVLRVDDKVSLFESNAINEYLDETIAPRLHPDDPVARAINRAWTDYVPTFAESVTAVAYAADEAAGRTRCNRVVNFDTGGRDLLGRVVEVRITRALPHSLRGELDSPEDPGVADRFPVGLAEPALPA